MALTRFRPRLPPEYIRDIEQEHLPGDKRRLTEIGKLSLSRTVAATALTSVANELLDAVESGWSDDVRDSVTETIVRGVLKKVHTHLRGERWKHFVSPVLSVVTALPKAELASMAESLVNLTSMKRHVSSVSETVGGPIDVALISKGDGFVWIKRKHYFDKDLNYHFFANYFRGGGMDEATQ